MKKSQAREPLEALLDELDEDFQQWYERARRRLRMQGWLNAFIALVCLVVILRLIVS